MAMVRMVWVAKRRDKLTDAVVVPPPPRFDLF
jgi:hypothetical protein